MAATQRVQMVFSTLDAIDAKLIELSMSGGAWVASFPGFGREAVLLRFSVPSRVPDHYQQSPNPFYEPRIAFRGKLCGFSKAAVIREQNRAIGCE